MTKSQRRAALAELRRARVRYASPHVREEYRALWAEKAKAMDAAIKVLRGMKCDG